MILDPNLPLASFLVSKKLAKGKVLFSFYRSGSNIKVRISIKSISYF